MGTVTFREWLLCQTSRPSAIGDLARDAKSDKDFAKGPGHAHMLMGRLRRKGACEGAKQAFREALIEYRSLDTLACMVESLPNGCSLIHFCTDFENENSAWKIVAYTGELLGYGRSVRAALMAFETGVRDREWWEAQLKDIEGIPGWEG